MFFPYKLILYYILNFFKRLFFLFQLPDIDLNKFYSPLEPETPSDDDSGKKPIVINLRNVSFSYNQPNQDNNDEHEVNNGFYIGPVSGDIKKVLKNIT